MAGYLSSSSSLKMKRKDLDEVNEDFSDFSLSSPARKIRRLDADLPPIMEDEELEVDMQPVFERFVPEKLGAERVGAPASVIREELPSVPVNEERAIVLFKSVSSPIIQSPSCFSVTLDSDMLSEFKNQFLRSSISEDSEAGRNHKNGASNQCMAVVPWVPSHFSPTPASGGSQMEMPESMEAEETGVATMDIEDNNVSIEQGRTLDFGGGLRGTESIQQWQQQQHCMTPHLPQNTSTPIVWYR